METSKSLELGRIYQIGILFEILKISFYKNDVLKFLQSLSIGSRRFLYNKKSFIDFLFDD
jgi:hypothetical protein